MTDQQERDVTILVRMLDIALTRARVSAEVRVVDVNGEPKLRISSRERGEKLYRLKTIVANVLEGAGTEYRQLGVEN